MKKLSLIFLSLFITASNLTNCMELQKEEAPLIGAEAGEANYFKFRYNNKTFELNDNFNSETQAAFGDLAKSKYFDTAKLKKEPKRLLEEAGAQEIEFETSDKKKIQGYFLDRGSDKALLIGQGFIDSCDVLIPFFKLFPDYDILIINYRWHSLKFLKNIFNDPLSKFIFEAKRDVAAAAKYLRNNKDYESLTGIGLCYSGLVYTIAQAQALKKGKRLFDKLAIDSGYYSTDWVADRVTTDPILCCENKHGGTPDFLQSIFSVIFTIPVNCMGNCCLGDQFEQLSIEQYLPSIKIPIMFIHGKNDLLVPFNPLFEQMYNAAYNAEYRCALITQNEHVLNHLKSKEAYSHLIQKFIEAESGEHLRIMLNNLLNKLIKSDKNN